MKSIWACTGMRSCYYCGLGLAIGSRSLSCFILKLILKMHGRCLWKYVLEKLKWCWAISIYACYAVLRKIHQIEKYIRLLSKLADFLHFLLTEEKEADIGKQSAESLPSLSRHQGGPWNDKSERSFKGFCATVHGVDLFFSSCCYCIIELLTKLLNFSCCSWFCVHE